MSMKKNTQLNAFLFHESAQAFLFQLVCFSSLLQQACSETLSDFKLDAFINLVLKKRSVFNSLYLAYLRTCNCASSLVTLLRKMAPNVDSIIHNLKGIGNKRQAHIKAIRQMASDHDRATQIYNKDRIAPTAVSGTGWLLGAIGSTAAIITTVGTGGLAAPLWALGIGLSGKSVFLHC